MDDGKVFAKDSQQLGKLLGVVNRVSESIGMELGLRKCAMAHIKRGKPVKGELLNGPGAENWKKGSFRGYGKIPRNCTSLSTRL